MSSGSDLIKRDMGHSLTVFFYNNSIIIYGVHLRIARVYIIRERPVTSVRGRGGF